ncbi:hypothetical protein [Bacillus marinisedimentorum]|uniref:hypothetical protein n=1 Tax=Bacillus marinisedimentorum TaxID=1821260 RepID=UPI00087348EB|nr:hypothetical protein [Bacillus marinisedimentorum]
MEQRIKTRTLPGNGEGEIGIRTELNALHPFESVSRFAGDSVDEHKDLEEVNEYFSEMTISQINRNS